MKWKIKFSDEALKKIDKIPDKDYEKLVEVIQGFKEGKLDPKKIGKPVKFIELKDKLICPKCNSKNVEWLLDKNSKEVDFYCNGCGESFWMTDKDYKKAVKRNPDKIILSKI